jgi:hypothetical protein
LVGDEDTFPASEDVSCRGGGEPKVLQLAKGQPEELAIAYVGSDSDCSRQYGFGSNEARETSLGEKGSVGEEGSSMVLSEDGGGLLLAPQESSSRLCAVLDDSGFDVDLVDQSQQKGNLELVIFSTEEGKVGHSTEAISVGS